jgi:hypothetical protein
MQPQKLSEATPPARPPAMMPAAAPKPTMVPAAGTAAPAAPTGAGSNGFTRAQLDTLKNQILTFRRIKKGEMPSQADLASVKPVPLGGPQPTGPPTAPGAGMAGKPQAAGMQQKKPLAPAMPAKVRL